MSQDKNKWIEDHFEVWSFSPSGESKKHDSVEFLKTKGKSLNDFYKNRKQIGEKDGRIQKK